MLDKARALIRKTWHDPVWSKVIAAAILAMGGLVVGFIFNQPETTPLSPPSKEPASQLYSEEQLAIRNMVIIGCEKNRDPHKSYDLVRDIPLAAQRDSELTTVAFEAICVGEEKFALEVFSKLTSLEEKDRSAIRIVDFYVKAKKLSDAKTWASFISNAQDRDWWFREILDAAHKNG